MGLRRFLRPPLFREKRPLPFAGPGRRLFFLALFAALSCFAPASWAGQAESSPEWGWKWFSNTGRAFAPLRADPREAAFRFGFFYNDDSKWMEDIAFGGDMGLVSQEESQELKTSLTARGLFTARFNFDSDSFDLQNTDFIGGLALGRRFGELSAELYLYHQSSHLGDEVLEGGRKRIDYGRETVRTLVSYDKAPWRLYGGPSFTFHANPQAIQNKLTFQCGAEYYFHPWRRAMYAAIDLQSRQENDWSVNTNTQIGYGLGGKRMEGNRQWLFLEFYNGHSNMGQFWDEYEVFGLVGISYWFH